MITAFPPPPRPGDAGLAGQPPLPRFTLEFQPPDITPWLAGNTGIPGFTSFISARPGPHVALLALIHGNELAGAVVLDELLRGGLRPARGRLTLGFANIAAFARFDPEQPTASRFVDEDLNRLWDASMLDGPRQSSELERARAMRPLIDSVDVLLDLHSMLWPSDPLILSGATAKGRALAEAIGMPGLVVADAGHVSGRRLIDYGRFASPAVANSAVLVEAGQHWGRQTVDMVRASVAGLLRHVGMAGNHPCLPPRPPAQAVRFAEVTQVVTAATSSFAFVRAFRGCDVVPRRNTLIAMDGDTEIRTVHDDCLLIMPSLRPSRGHTAVRLARLVP
jgi:predicted deacylase